MGRGTALCQDPSPVGAHPGVRGHPLLVETKRGKVINVET